MVFLDQVTRQEERDFYTGDLAVVPASGVCVCEWGVPSLLESGTHPIFENGD